MYCVSNGYKVFIFFHLFWLKPAETVFLIIYTLPLSCSYEGYFYLYPILLAHKSIMLFTTTWGSHGPGQSETSRRYIWFAVLKTHLTSLIPLNTPHAWLELAISCLSPPFSLLLAGHTKSKDTLYWRFMGEPIWDFYFHFPFLLLICVTWGKNIVYWYFLFHLFCCLKSEMYLWGGNLVIFNPRPQPTATATTNSSLSSPLYYLPIPFARSWGRFFVRDIWIYQIGFFHVAHTCPWMGGYMIWI